MSVGHEAARAFYEIENESFQTTRASSEAKPNAREIPRLEPTGYGRRSVFAAPLAGSTGNETFVITGASAGNLGAALNLSMVQDAFGNDAKVDALLDSGAPFTDKYMPPCMQKRWRESWGFADALPSDCTECKQADGGGMIRMADFLIKKHPNSTLAAVTSIHDEVIRLFFSVGVKNCANFDTVDPVMITMGQVLDPTILYASADYEAAMQELRSTYKSSGRFATHFMSGANGTVHQHIFRTRFTDPAGGSETIAKFVGNWLNGSFDHIGP
jgi:hypothetical protein